MSSDKKDETYKALYGMTYEAYTKTPEFKERMEKIFVSCNRACEYQVPGTCSGHCSRRTVLLVGKDCLSQIPPTSSIADRMKRNEWTGEERRLE